MYCPKCQTENPDDAQLCCSCSWVLTSTSTGVPSPDAKTSGLAITALVLTILSFCTFGITAIPAMIFGIVGLVKIEKSAGRLKGKGLAIAGIAVPAAIAPIALMMGILMPALARTRELAHRIVCETNMKGLGKAMMVYALNYDDKYPTILKWCDLLIEGDFCTCKQFVCKSSDTIEGESSYAMNINLAGKKFSELSSNVVVLFETNFGKSPAGRDCLLKDRQWYQYLPFGDGETKVYRLRWNQAGGPEMLTTENHQGDGCNVLFADGRVEFVGTNDLNDLEWTAEQNE